jgi:hypothetical protein
MRINIKLFATILFFTCSCGSFKYLPNLNEIKPPFDKRNFQDTDKSFFVISNSSGSNINAIKSNTIALAQAELSQRIEYSIGNYVNLNMRNNNNTSLISSELNSIIQSNIFLNKIKIVESKLFKKNDVYEYWAVYKINISDVVSIVNSLTKSIELKPDFYKSSIDENYSLKAKKKVDLKLDGLKLIDTNAAIIEEAKKYLGVPYVWGGDSPSEGFDCSGYVQWVTNEATGVFLPRTAKEQYAYLNQKNKDLKKIKMGDIVFFNTNGKGVSHVGIALDNDKFIHSPNKKGKIRIDQFNGYWDKKFISSAKIQNL